MGDDGDLGSVQCLVVFSVEEAVVFSVHSNSTVSKNFLCALFLAAWSWGLVRALSETLQTIQCPFDEFLCFLTPSESVLFLAPKNCE